MNHSEILTNADQVSKKHARTYGPEEMCYERIAHIATLILNKHLSPHDIALVEVAISLGRLQEDRLNPEHYIMAVKHMAFGGQFAIAPESVGTALEDDIAAMARRFAPKRKQVTPEEQAAVLENMANFAAPQQEASNA
jgi:hypothetical protein